MPNKTGGDDKLGAAFMFIMLIYVLHGWNEDTKIRSIRSDMRRSSYKLDDMKRDLDQLRGENKKLKAEVEKFKDDMKSKAFDEELERIRRGK